MKKEIFAGILILCILFLFPGMVFSQEVCNECHNDESLESEAGKSVYVSVDKYGVSIHGQAEISCVDCHSDLSEDDDFPHAEKLEKVSCAACHDDISEMYAVSLHGVALEKGSEMAPDCKSCHSYHNTLPSDDPESKIARINISTNCGKCHQQEIPFVGTDIKIGKIYNLYSNGIHNTSMTEGNTNAATCTDCHEHHDLKNISDPSSLVYRFNIPKTCAKCHEDISKEYNHGIHGQAFNIGIRDAPNCTDCHGEHEIIKTDDPDSPVSSINVSHIVCARCHNDPLLIEKYSLKGERISSYEDTYHGLAIKGKSKIAATCVSCHGFHDILPTANPNSLVNENNIETTCGKCHENVNPTFALSYTHESSIVAENSVNYYVKNFYILMIVAVVGGMLLHNFIIWLKFLRDKLKWKSRYKHVRRFDKVLVYIHIVNLISFGILVFTGFGLRYPDTWWVKFLNSIGLTEAARGITHRVAAVLMIYACTHFLFYSIFNKNGRKNIKYIMLKLSDIKEVIGNLKYHLGIEKEKPEVEKFDYTQKVEFWALVWGTIVMVATGFILWFPTEFSSFLPSWGIKVAETIHFYEAWLATLSILIFHLFFVFWHPEEYPMDVTWLSGEIPEEECKEKYPLWYEKEIKKNNKT
ncbi:cytochrome c3 family protein [candidate division KSB1 bacterium]